MQKLALLFSILSACIIFAYGQANVKPGVPRNVQVLSLTGSTNRTMYPTGRVLANDSATIMWDPPSNAIAIGTLFYTIYVSINLHGTVAPDPTPFSTRSATSYVLTGLYGGSTVTISVQAVSSTGQASTLSDSQQFDVKLGYGTVPGFTPTPLPGVPKFDISVVNISSTAAQVVWTAPPNIDILMQPISYAVILTKSGGLPLTIPVNDSEGFEAALSLSSSTRYSVQVAVQDGFEQIVQTSNPTSFSTISLPLQPVKVYTQMIGRRAINMSWDADPTSLGGPFSYNIRLIGNPYLEYNASVPWIILNNLPYKQRWWVNIYTLNRFGETSVNGANVNLVTGDPTAHTPSPTPYLNLWPSSAPRAAPLSSLFFTVFLSFLAAAVVGLKLH